MRLDPLDWKGDYRYGALGIDTSDYGGYRLRDLPQSETDNWLSEAGALPPHIPHGYVRLTGCVFLYMGTLHPVNFIADGVGLAAGLVLGYYAIKHIRFEQREDIWYYRTHLWVEVTVIVLLLGRIVYKLLELYLQAPSTFQTGGASSMDIYTRDPITVGIFFVLISFYIRYFTYLLGKQKKLVAPNSP
jgi:hypothetical protein